ncbi:DUF177 domain-containing protein [Thalassococcus sp. CAU 1522]|uniref:DUF177 domain-containing protein n=1 Tax=Thalassococcus arenae TaxID=2851652 RepID=A0ABS6N9R5_9RHOB|nr:DUF177 domain-containing protein [Thalassococcus arenae]MBV2360760.1 DUF177 domain-containing protein [Thalassococcus arenae]
MPAHEAKTTRLTPSALDQNHPTEFTIVPDAPTRHALADELGLLDLRKLRFAGALHPEGKAGFVLKAELGATVVQPCVVTLAPVTTRIDTPVLRRFVPADRLEHFEAGSETETPEDDSIEPLGAVIDLDAVMAEALALALPVYPRAEGADLGEAVFAGQGIDPLRDDDLKPLAGLAALRDKLTDGNKE